MTLRPTALIPLMLVAWISWNVVQEYFDPYSGDLDHELYFGQRALLGQLPWTYEYFNRLPASQFVMAGAAALGGIQGWRTISILSVAVASVWIFRSLQTIFSSFDGISFQQARNAAASTVILSLSIFVVVPGGLTQINALPSSIVMAVTTYLYSLVISRPTAIGPAILAATSSLLAVALSMRPFFLGPFVFLCLWLVLMARAEFFPTRRSNPGIRLFALTGLLGLTFNLGPYLVLGEGRAFIDGMRAIQEGTPGVEFTTKAVLFIIVVAIFGLGIYHFTARSEALGFVPLLGASVVGLLVMISSQHFWSHYLGFFIWYAVAIFVASSLRLTKIAALRGFFDPQNISLASIGSSLVLGSVVAGCSLYFADQIRGPFIDARHSYVTVVKALEARFGAEQFSFLSPRIMYPHWVASESRRGLPGGGATRPILEGFWKDVRNYESFTLPRDGDSYCAQIRSSGVRFVIVADNYLPSSCFVDDSGRQWTQLLDREKRPWPGDIVVFENPDPAPGSR